MSCGHMVRSQISAPAIDLAGILRVVNIGASRLADPACLQAVIERDGVFRVPKRSGCFVADA